MPSIVQAINDFKFEPTPGDILEFLIKREALKNSLPVNDGILENSKFLNVFREDDAVSKVVNSQLDKFHNVDNKVFAKHLSLIHISEPTRPY